MEKLIDPPRGFRTDTIDLHQVRDRGALDRFERAKVMQQGTLSRRPNACDFLEAGFAQIAHPARPVRADRKTMRLITQPLDKIQQQDRAAAA